MLSEHKTVVSESLEDKKLRLERILRELGQVAVAFSGGVDSALLLKAAVRGLGTSAVLAVTVSSPVHPAWERAEAEWLAGDLGVRHIVIESDELEDESFVSNSPDRCYVCKFARFRELKRIAREHGFAHVVDGSNVDDLHDFRPGQRAAAEHGVRSPLREAGFTKAGNWTCIPGTGRRRLVWRLASLMESASPRRDSPRSVRRKISCGVSSPARCGFGIMGTWRGSRWNPRS